MNVDWRMPLAGTSLTRQVIERIRLGLMDGDLKPGDRLPTEAELSKMWQASRTPIREAIKVLEYMGIVEIRRGEGTFLCSEVKPAALNPLLFRLLSMAHSLHHLVEFRFEIDWMVLRLAIEKATEDDLAALRENVREMEEAVEAAAPPEELLRLDLEFHDLLAGATRNPLIRELAQELLRMFTRSIRRSHEETRGRHAVLHHWKMLRALESRDLTLGEEALRESLAVWRAFCPPEREAAPSVSSN